MSTEENMNFSKADIIFAFAMLPCGFLYWNLLDSYKLGAGVTVFAAVIFSASFVYMSKSGYRQNVKSLVCLILAALCSVQFLLFDNQFISYLNLVFLTGLFIYWICLSTGRHMDKKLSVYMIGDGVKQVIYMPFMNFSCCAVGIKKYFSGQREGRGIIAALVGVLIFLPLLAAVVNLLVSADRAFENFIDEFCGLINFFTLTIYIRQFIFGIPVAFYLYGLLYGNILGRHDEKVTARTFDRAANFIKVAPRLTIYGALTAFNIVYLVFFAVQAAYLFSAFGGTLPEAFTYAEYARRGFFELCAVAGINLVVLTISYMTIKREAGEEPMALRAEIVIISVFTMLLIATALSKMAMYISAYGLTQLRVFTSWFMILLLLVFLIIFVRQFIRFNSARSIIVVFVTMFMILSYGNADGNIAKYNIARYEAGTLATLDIDALSELSAAAVPHIYGLYMRTDKNEYVLSQRLKRVINMSAKPGGETGFRGFNIQDFKADEIRVIL